MPTITFHPTPNPNSLKFVVEDGAILDNGMLVFGNAAEAHNHSLGRALFAIEGVVNVFALPQFLTVSKAPAADWNDIVPGVEAAIIDFLD